MEDILSAYGIEIVVGMIAAVLITLFARVIYYSIKEKNDPH